MALRYPQAEQARTELETSKTREGEERGLHRLSDFSFLETLKMR
jgi:hypothetical protein